MGLFYLSSFPFFSSNHCMLYVCVPAKISIFLLLLRYMPPWRIRMLQCGYRKVFIRALNSVSPSPLLNLGALKRSFTGGGQMRSFKKVCVFVTQRTFVGKGRAWRLEFFYLFAIMHLCLYLLHSHCLPPRVATDKNIESTNANTASAAASLPSIQQPSL